MFWYVSNISNYLAFGPAPGSVQIYVRSVCFCTVAAPSTANYSGTVVTAAAQESGSDPL
jgi:hypothetical protein